MKTNETDPKPLPTTHLRHILLPLLLGTLLVGLAGPKQALAITYGTKDGNAHPYVGMVVFYDAEGIRMYRCSGTLISPTVFLTAGHCGQGFPDRPAASARIYFDSEVDTNTSSYVTGTPIPNPGYAESFGGGAIYNRLAMMSPS